MTPRPPGQVALDAAGASANQPGELNQAGSGISEEPGSPPFTAQAGGSEPAYTLIFSFLLFLVFIK